MERISIFNYEAFYLDYLEGNLSETDTQMLLQFLEEHPECRMEDDELVTLEDGAPMTFSGKHNLKQVDEAAPIVMDNVEHFMIADAEGLLDNAKKEELNAVVAEDQALEATRNRYKAVYFAPDDSIVFAGKAILKQRKALVLWPYMSGAVAAAAVVVFIMLPLRGIDEIPFEVPRVSVELPNGPTHPISPVNDTKDTNVTENDGPIIRYANNAVTTTPERVIVTDRAAMKQRKIGSVGSKVIDLALQPVNTSDNFAPNTPIQSEPGPFMGVNSTNDLAMENPIEPVTSFIAEKSKTDVEFKRRKATKEKKGGFFLKIGKFEFSKNKN